MSISSGAGRPPGPISQARFTGWTPVTLSTSADHTTSLSLHVPAQPPASRYQQPRCHLLEGHRETPLETQAGDAGPVGSARLRRALLRMGNLVPPLSHPQPQAQGPWLLSVTPPPPPCSGEQPLHPLCHSPPHRSQSALKAHPCFANLVSLWGCTGRSKQRLDPGKPSLPALPSYPATALAWLGSPGRMSATPLTLGMRKLQDLAGTSSTSDQENTRLRD